MIKLIKGKNDLLSCRPDVAKEWNKEKNGGMVLEEMMVASVVWLHKNKKQHFGKELFYGKINFG